MFTTKNITKMGVVAALYVALTLLTKPIAYGVVQFRISEVLNILAFFNPIYIIALTVGCLISNLLSPVGLYDIIFGTMHTLIATTAMWKIKNLYVSSLMPSLFSFIISFMICLYEGSYAMFFLNWAYVALSEFIIVSIIGVVFAMVLIKSGQYKLFTEDNFKKL